MDQDIIINKKIKLNNSNYDDKLFSLIIGNVFLFRKIFDYSKLYKKNECVIFKSKKELLEYSEREYINTIIYKSNEMLEKGDLPNSGILREISFTKNELSAIDGESIPFGCEIVSFYHNDNDNDEPIFPSKSFTSFPSTIHTLKNVLVDYKLLKNSNYPNKNNRDYYEIPANISSISFTTVGKIGPCISANDEGHTPIKIPKTLRELEFNGYRFNNKDIKLKKGDIPEGITTLKMDRLNTHNIPHGVLPNSIIKLFMSCDNSGPDDDDDDDEEKEEENDDDEKADDLSKIIPPNVEILHLYMEEHLTPRLNLRKCKSIKKLVVNFNNEAKEIKPNSLPSSINDLKIYSIYGDHLNSNSIPKSVTKLKIIFYGVESEFQKGGIPNSVTSLTINMPITEEDVFPSLLTSLVLTDKEFVADEFDEDSIASMIELLPKSLTSITIPSKFKDSDVISFPSNITNISYI